MRRWTGFAVSLPSLALALAGASAGCKKDQLEGAKAEVQETSVKLDLPPVPEFTMPAPNPDGTHPVTEMRLKGNKFLDTEVQVKGFVVWIYDCATAIRTPEMTDKQLATLLENEPERCSRPHFTIADAANTPPDRGVWVVDIPRPLRKDDKLLGKEILAQMEAEWKALPPFKIGDEVVVTGKWTLLSAKGFRHSDGLVEYKSMVNNTAPVAMPPGAPGAPGAPAAPGAPQK